MIHDLNNINTDKYRESSPLRGENPGFDTLYEVMSLMPGYPIFIAGDPYSGKTSITLEILVSQAEMYQKKSVLYLGETGELEDIKGELASMYIKKPYKKMKSKDEENLYAMNEAERHKADLWVADHFHIFDPNKDYTLLDFYKEVDEYEVMMGVRFDHTLFDPVVDAKGWQQSADYLLPELKMVCRNSQLRKRINILVNHIGDTDKVRGKDNKRVKLPALPDEWAGGKSFFRRAFQMLLIYRPPIDSLYDGEPVKENETWVVCQKSKPKGVGKTGKAILFYNWKKNRFYEEHRTAGKMYAGEIQGLGNKADNMPF